MPTVPAKAGTHRVYLCLTQERPATAKGSGLIP